MRQESHGQETVEISRRALIDLTQFAQQRTYELSRSEYRAYMMAASALGWNQA